ncbi:hypothetical protein [Nocardia thailandica]|uniref:hypothetical protein n=1 Tax=Nocardia thailandica TaxID=257275 RepID=UPI00030FB1D2|nr:hypothetical protein [Nocardia thailandica]
MSDPADLVTRLAALPDDELRAVLRAAVLGRAGFGAVVAALGAGDAPTPAPVTLGTSAPPSLPVFGASGEVEAEIVVPPVPHSAGPAATGGYSATGVPTFDAVRDKVEQRFGTAQGMGELDRQTPAGRGADEQWEAREQAARERLARIRESMKHDD